MMSSMPDFGRHAGFGDKPVANERIGIAGEQFERHLAARKTMFCLPHFGPVADAERARQLVPVVDDVADPEHAGRSGNSTAGSRFA
jgi:hypothetical protein